MKTNTPATIVFLQAPAWGRDCPPYTMCHLAALVRSRGHQAHLFDLNNALYHTSSYELKKMWDDKDFYAFWENTELVEGMLKSNEKLLDFYIDKILSTGAKTIGFTVHFSSAWASLAIARRIKERDKNRIIVFGGPDCSRQMKGDYLIQQECVDVVVHGEGEKPLLSIIENVKDIKNMASIPGCLLLREGQIIDGGYVPGPDDLDSLPMPDYSDFRDDITLRMYREPHRLDIFDSRGCPTRCHFCSEWQFWGKFRAKSGKRIFEEVQHYRKQFPQVNFFYFIGSLMNGNMRVLEKFCDLLIQNKLGINWAGQAVIRPEMTAGFLRKMRSAGCTWIGYGIESGSQRVIDTINKRFSMEAASRVLEDTKKAGISTQANFMFGIPTETPEDFSQTLSFLKNNHTSMDTILASQSFCVIDKGTYLYDHPEEFGIRGRNHHLYWSSNTGENNYTERSRRYETFCQEALALGIPETSGVLRNKPDKYQLLGDYFMYERNYPSAIEQYLQALSRERKTRTLYDKISRCYEGVGDYVRAQEMLNHALELDSGVFTNGLSDASLLARLDIFKKLSRDTSLNLSVFKSQDLAKALRQLKNSKFNGVDLAKICSDFKLSDKHSSMVRALYSHGLWEKLSNLILVEAQKARRESFLYGYPYWLIIDPCNLCNLSCPFCPTGQKRGSRPKGKLTLDDFKAIMDKLGPYAIHVDLVNWGEPFLNDELPEMVRYAKQFHADVKIDSNLNIFSEETARKLISGGLDKIVVSIDGITQETYAKYRRGGNFKVAMDHLKLLLKIRKEIRSKKPYITWQFLVFKHNEHEVEHVKNIGAKLGVDHVGITKAFIGDKAWIPSNPEYSNYNKEEIKGDLTYEHFKKEHSFCNWPWEAIAFNTNASVSSCCSVEDAKDDFGAFFDQPFEELWNSARFVSARQHIAQTAMADGSSGNICLRCKHAGLINIDILSCHSFFD